MKPRVLGLPSLARLSLGQCYRRPIAPNFGITPSSKPANGQLRGFAFTNHLRRFGVRDDSYENSNARPAMDLNHNITQEEKEEYEKELQSKTRQMRAPWNREGSDVPPVARQRSAGAMTKGKLLTTPSRMLKLILPLTTRDLNTDRKDIEPLALLVHPQQPLSYLERLIQAELPVIKDGGKERIPHVYFLAEDSMQDTMETSKPHKTTVSDGSEALGDKDGDLDFEKVDEFRFDGKVEKTGKLSSSKNRKSVDEAADLRGGQGKGGVESYSGLGQDAPADKKANRKFVRWSSSTEIGDFIRDAARGREFAVEIEGAPNEIRVGVPSFNDRTYYLRMRLRKTAHKISEMADIKKECDRLAHKAAQRVAMGGLAVVVGWWGLVYQLTFKTDLGWDVMEPVTYLVGLSTLIGGYVWFLYHNREVSYRSAMNFTISRRQSKLYQMHNFDLRKWEVLIEEGNSLRKEIKAVANEYDVEWDETLDEKDESVTEALRNERKKKKDEAKDDEGGGEKAKRDGED